MILDQIAEATRKRVQREKEIVSLEQIRQQALELSDKTNKCLNYFAFENALKKEGIHFICEVKKASPSKGIIAEKFPYIEIAREYEQAGAAAVSVLTEPEFFLGSDDYFKEIRKEIKIPMLRKDFTVDVYQIYQAKIMGADCVLLICALLEESIIKEYIKICDSLSISALVEAHDEAEIEAAVRAGARLIGVNNRNLKTFDVNISNSSSLRQLMPESVLFVSESGIQHVEDIRAFKGVGVNGILIGEMLMRSGNKKKMLKDLLVEASLCQ